MLTELARQATALRHGEHIGLIYDDLTEHLAAVVPFFQAGLAQREQCVHVVASDLMRAQVIRALQEAGIDIDDAMKRRAIVFVEKHDYRSDPLTVEGMEESVRRLIWQGIEQGCRGLRLVVDMNWTLDIMVEPHELEEWESAWNRLFSDVPMSAICSYSAKQMGQEALLAALRTHPHVAFGSQLEENAFYAPSTALLSSKRGDGPAPSAMLVQLRRAYEAKEALHRHRAYFRALLEHSYDAAAVADEQAAIAYASPAMHRVLGYAPQELMGKAMPDLVLADDRERAAAAFAETLQAGEHRVAGEFRVLDPEGAVRWIEMTRTNLTDEPSVGGMVINLRNVTERRLAEDALRRSEEGFRALVERSFDGIALLKADAIITYASPSLLAMLGYPQEEFAGRSAFAFVHPEDRLDLEWRFAARIRDGGQSSIFEFRCLHHDGSWRWLEAIASNLLDQPSVEAVVINVRDVTERKEVEEEILELSTPLLPIRERILLVPLVGRLDERRMDRTQRRVLEGVQSHRAQVVILDMTGAARPGQEAVRQFVQMVQAARLLGAEVVVTGISASLAEAIVRLGTNVRLLRTLGDLQSGIAEALRLTAVPPGDDDYDGEGA